MSLVSETELDSVGDLRAGGVNRWNFSRTSAGGCRAGPGNSGRQSGVGAEVFLRLVAGRSPQSYAPTTSPVTAPPASPTHHHKPPPPDRHPRTDHPQPARLRPARVPKPSGLRRRGRQHPHDRHPRTLPAPGQRPPPQSSHPTTRPQAVPILLALLISKTLPAGPDNPHPQPNRPAAPSPPQGSNACALSRCGRRRGAGRRWRGGGR